MDARGIAPARVWRQGAFALVHRQHVFTPEDAQEKMPLEGPSGGILAADVRLDNRGELADRLGLSGAAAAVPDGALVLKALERWGGDAVTRLYGDFAFALWQPGSRTLTLARDPLQGRSLFIHHGPKVIAFATRLRPLLALPDVPREIDGMAVADRLILNTADSGQTLYKAIRRVPQGHILTITPERAVQRCWWSMPRPGTLRFASHAETVEAATEVVDRAVAASVRAVGPVGTCLTGGLDSSTVTLFARRYVDPDRLFALTRVPGGPVPPDEDGHYYDESGRAAAFAARQPGLLWHTVGDDGQDWGERNRARWHLSSGMPADNRVNGAWFLPLFRFMAERGGRVILGGGGGNFLYSYHGGAVELSLLRQGRIWALLRHLYQREKHAPLGLLPLIRNRFFAPCEPWWLRSWRRGWPGLPWGFFSALNPSFAAEVKMRDRLDLDRYRIRTGVRVPSAHASRCWFHGDETLGQWMVEYRALHGMDWRDPLGSRWSTEFFAALPQEAFVHNGVTRAIARSILAPHLPEDVRRDRRTGRQLGDWYTILSAERPAMLAALERLKASPAASRLIDLSRLERLLHTWPASVAEAERQRLDYSFVLTRGLETAEFLAWQDSSNHGSSGPLPE